MRAPSKKASAAAAREADSRRSGETPTAETVTRISPFRVSTLVSIAPVNLTTDWGVMARQEGDPVPYEHQFYRATLQGLFSLNLHAAGTFSYQEKTGYLNLDSPRVEEAKKAGLEHLVEEKAYRLPVTERLNRIIALLEGLANVEGGAKQTLHYTDVSPDLVITAVTRGGNHIFGHVISADRQGRPRIKVQALRQTLTVFDKDIWSRVYVGWVEGYLDEEREAFVTALSDPEGLQPWAERFNVAHPRQALLELVNELRQRVEWLA